MTQFKEKSAKQRELVSAGLFFYPVLMAADVLAYRTDEVPVGDDQRQHLELMRDIAIRFNARFGEVLVVPEAADPGGRRADHGPAGPDEQDVDDHGERRTGRVYVLDEPATIERKFKRAVTDSGERRAPRARQAGDHQPDRHPRRGARRRPRSRSSASSRTPATATSRPRSRPR